MIAKKDRETQHAKRGSIPAVRMPRDPAGQNKVGARKTSMAAARGADKP